MDKIRNVVLVEDPWGSPRAQIDEVLAVHKLKMQENIASMSLTISGWRYSTTHVMKYNYCMYTCGFCINANLVKEGVEGLRMTKIKLLFIINKEHDDSGFNSTTDTGTRWFNKYFNIFPIIIHNISLYIKLVKWLTLVLESSESECHQLHSDTVCIRINMRMYSSV